MEMKHFKALAGIACLVLAGAWVFHAMSGSGSADGQRMSSGAEHSVDSRRNSRSGQHHNAARLENGPPSIPRALELPTRPVDEKSLQGKESDVAATAANKRLSLPDDDILMRGGVLPATTKTGSAGDKMNGQRSIKSEDWKGAANLLVNALRSGDRFEVNQDELMNFLRGKDLLGWPESYRNWIGDELMTALRQDMPETAFDSLKSIEADSTAPAAMRDYSVQHISHLVTSGVIGKEGAEYIWQTLKKNDSQTLATALISLHRLSEQVPELVSAKEVQAAAGRLKESPDERTRITAKSILKK